MYRRYYIRSNNCITIIDEKKEIEPWFYLRDY
jgi:hypothetical protein